MVRVFGISFTGDAGVTTFDEPHCRGSPANC